VAKSADFANIIAEWLRRLTAGAEQGTGIVVTSGLKQGEFVITEGIQKVRPGQVVSASPPMGR
jgi:membrane fusion protein, multidrug efflux system